ncbi:MAG TPA: RsbRD N-terminal domain-containing protein [Bryobacteraceae bacterium]|nr:RsbRD N-terminal domain-containing protein [Bryobacteraceae bacterium]
METRQAIAEQWLGCALRTSSGPAAALVAPERDRFRNPAGYTLRRAMSVLLDELLLGMDRERIAEALDSIVQLRAVQDLPPGRALAFLFQLKPILAEFAPGEGLDQLYARIDEMALAAFDLYLKYRERAFEARSNEVKRRVFVLQRRFGGGIV